MDLDLNVLNIHRVASCLNALDRKKNKKQTNKPTQTKTKKTTKPKSKKEQFSFFFHKENIFLQLKIGGGAKEPCHEKI